MKCIKQTEHFYQIDGKKIKIARTEKEWTLEALSRVSGVSRKTISEIEKGMKRKIRFSTIEQISKAMDKEVDSFCTKLESRGGDYEYYL